MFCLKCGSTIGDNAKFCAKCGALVPEPNTSSEQSHFDEPMTRDESVEAAAAASDAEKNKRIMVMFISIACVIITFVVVVIYSQLPTDHKKAKETTARYTSAATTTAATTTMATSAETTITNSIIGSGTWEYADSNGYSYSLTFSVYNPILNAVVGETSHPYDSDETLMSSFYDPKTDLVIPATVSIKNTTNNFDIYASFKGTITGSSSVDVIIDACFYDGFESYNVDIFLSEEYYSAEWTDPLVSNQTGVSCFFIIIDDYYSPNYPNGNIALLDELAFYPTTTNGEYVSDDNYGYSLTGPN